MLWAAMNFAKGEEQILELHHHVSDALFLSEADELNQTPSLTLHSNRGEEHSEAGRMPAICVMD